MVLAEARQFSPNIIGNITCQHNKISYVQKSVFFTEFPKEGQARIISLIPKVYMLIFTSKINQNQSSTTTGYDITLKQG